MWNEAITFLKFWSLHILISTHIFCQQDGAPLDVGRHILNDIGNRHTLTLPVAGEDAFGQYTCQAENQYGKSSKTTEVSGKKHRLE